MDDPFMMFVVGGTMSDQLFLPLSCLRQQLLLHQPGSRKLATQRACPLPTYQITVSLLPGPSHLLFSTLSFSVPLTSSFRKNSLFPTLSPCFGSPSPFFTLGPYPTLQKTYTNPKTAPVSRACIGFEITSEARRKARRR